MWFSYFQAILRNTIELQVSPETMKRFFKPVSDVLPTPLKSPVKSEGPLEDLACESKRDRVPRYSRAKNVNNKWVYLAQIGNNEIQEVEVTVCKNPNNKCLNDMDSPHGEGSTLCKQVLSTQKLLALDEDGNVNVDTFELPSACICKTKVKALFGFRLRAAPLSRTRGNGQLPPICLKEESTQALDHERYTNIIYPSYSQLFQLFCDRFDRGPLLDNNRDIMATPMLKTVAANVTPCEDNDFGDTICSDDDEGDSNYPTDEVKRVLYRHKLFRSRAFFERLFGRPCEPLTNPNTLAVRGGFDLNEEALCDAFEKYIYPKKAKNIDGVWKYIVNTDDYRQGVTIHRCLSQIKDSSCLYAGSEGINPEVTECKQMYSKQNLLAISLQGTVDYDFFLVPSACVCHIIEKDFFYTFDG
jgi:hypothetical protein